MYTDTDIAPPKKHSEAPNALCPSLLLEVGVVAEDLHGGLRVGVEGRLEAQVRDACLFIYLGRGGVVMVSCFGSYFTCVRVGRSLFCFFFSSIAVAVAEHGTVHTQVCAPTHRCAGRRS